MTVETDLQNAVAAASALNQTVRSEIDAIDAALENAITQNQTQTNDAISSLDSKVTKYVSNARGEYPLPPNLISNSFMIELEEALPLGFGYSGVQIEAVHPYTHAFEGPYVENKPSTAVDDITLATQSTPYWFGRYNKGPRISRGGLADGWNGIGTGHILKITASPSDTRSWTTVYFPMARLASTNQIGFRGYLKIVQGTSAGFGTDSGYQGSPRGYTVTKNQTDAAPQGWLKLAFTRGTSQVTRPMSSNFCLGFRRDEPIEAYLALPYAYIPAGASPGIVLE